MVREILGCCRVQRVQQLTNVEQQSSGQHKENSASRIKRDTQNTDIVMKFLEKGSPFSGDCNTLRCIATGKCFKFTMLCYYV
jgi:hypothetical protein